MTVPRTPGQETVSMKGMVEVQKIMADAAMAQPGKMTMSMMVTALSTDPIPDDVLALPAGYTKK